VSVVQQNLNRLIKRLNTFHTSQKTKCVILSLRHQIQFSDFQMPIYRRIFLANYPIFSSFLFCGIQQNLYICIAFEKIP